MIIDFIINLIAILQFCLILSKRYCNQFIHIFLLDKTYNPAQSNF